MKMQFQGSEAACKPQRKRRGGLFVTDAELIEKLGLPTRIGCQTLRLLDSHCEGFPKKHKLWGDRRYWPAVKAYLDRTCGVSMIAYPQRNPQRYAIHRLRNSEARCACRFPHEQSPGRDQRRG